jgi:hypothetical protein
MFRRFSGADRAETSTLAIGRPDGRWRVGRQVGMIERPRGLSQPSCPELLTMRPGPLATEQVSRYERDGYFIIPELF